MSSPYNIFFSNHTGANQTKLYIIRLITINDCLNIFNNLLGSEMLFKVVFWSIYILPIIFRTYFMFKTSFSCPVTIYVTTSKNQFKLVIFTVIKQYVNDTLTLYLKPGAFNLL